MNKTIWMYWENRKGSTKPAYLDLCLETIIKHSPHYDVIVLNEKTVFDYLPSLRNDLYKLKEIAHRADYIRASIVYEYGGIWLDSDVILLNEIDTMYLDKYGYVGCGIEYGKPSIWFFGAWRHSAILREWIHQMNIKLAKKLHRKWRRSFKWTELGYDILWKLFKGYDYYNIDFKKFAPIIWSKWEDFFRDDISLDSIIEKDTIAVMLYNKFMFEPLKDTSRTELLNGNTLLSKLFRFSLGEDAKG